MNKKPYNNVPYSEHDYDLVYRFHVGDIDMVELQAQLDFWRPACQLTQKALRAFGKRHIQAGWTPEENEIVAQLARKEMGCNESNACLSIKRALKKVEKALI